MTEKRGRGRPEKYREEYAAQAVKLCKLGAIDEDLCDFFGVAESTLNLWKLKHAEFKAALDEGKEVANNKVVQALFKRATGYSHPDTHISNYQGEITETVVTKHYPPDTTACIYWLKNRDPENWRDKQEIEHGGKVAHEHEFLESIKPTIGPPSERDS